MTYTGLLDVSDNYIAGLPRNHCITDYGSLFGEVSGGNFLPQKGLGLIRVGPRITIVSVAGR